MALTAAAAGETHFRWWFARAIFPIVLVAALAAAFQLIEEGWSAPAAAAVTQIAAFLVVIVCERLVAYHASWNRSRGDLKVDAAHMLTILVVGFGVQPVIVFAGVAVSIWLSSTFGLGFWPHDWPLLAQLGLALVVVEFFQYWVHRLQHTVDWMWRFHATHHSAPRLYWLNASRFHFVDILMLNFAGHLPLIALGAPPAMLALWTLFSSIHGVFQHANLPLRLGPLNWIFSMAELHRWHHSPVTEFANHNYGQNLILWDVVFGTRWLPADREPPEEIGLDGLPMFPMTWGAQILSPLRWKEIAERSRAELAARG